MDKHLLESLMEEVYTMVPYMGITRAISSVAGQRFDENTQTFVPDVDLIEIMTKQYEQDFEMEWN